MGVANSKIEEDKALVLCRERKRLVGQALDERCSLAAAHVSYVQSLTNIGIALRQFVDLGSPVKSSLYTSTFATPEPLAPTDKPVSQFSNSSPSLSQHMEIAESFSPVPSLLSSGHLHVNHMKARTTSYMTVKEKPPTSVTMTLQTSPATPKHLASQSDEISSFENSPTPTGMQPWDYFGVPHPIDNQLSFQDGRGLNYGFDNANEIRHLSEEDGIPDFEEEEGDIAHEKNDLDSEDDFDQPSNEPLVRIFKNRNLVSEHQSKSDNSTIQSMVDIVSVTKHQNGDDMKLKNGIYENDRSPEKTPTKVASIKVAFSINGKAEESNPETNHEARDFLSCMNEIEELFLKASESGREVPRMLEANKVEFRPLFPEGKVSATNEVKYLTWHRSVSLLSSSSENFLGAMTKDDTQEPNGTLFNGTYMNSGSHASTLDRLYAWERKLYDEVKASGIIRREYDMKCRLLRQKESTKVKPENIDKIRAIVKDLHSRIRVAIQRIDSISKKIEEIRDKELEPQLEELIGGLTRMWRTMLDYHSHQYSIISLAFNNGSNKVSIQSELECRATVLEFELNSLGSNFTEWVSAHKSYLQTINEWLRKGVVLSQKRNKSFKRRPPQFCPKKDMAPPIFVTCEDWLLLLNSLPTKEVESAIKDLVTVTTHYLPRQEKKGYGTSKLSFSLPQNAEQGDKLGEHVHTNDTHANGSLDYGNLKSALMEFLDKLNYFAKSSVSGYEALQKSIDEFRVSYGEHEFCLFPTSLGLGKNK
ncbi:Endoplasmic reticulum-Golgi intermediate compartment protein [Musa troglodytarum]|uniref:Endoplasmic reticulum-Golgi intermediate compartment protein n=1 Tax=Musa troglodytarum TaxID=320322 RepID=A0A9E7L5E8_9LILI|nr:Endoplasmic reticulum-Golgi intermediate compartment protein [Musa troglodytarum]